MNKLLKTVLSVLLCFTLLLSATSCDLVERVKGLFEKDEPEGPKKPERVVVEVPEGYTGGSRYAQPEYYEIYWFETVAEAKDAISRLEAHGSTVYKSALLDYSSEDYDVKVMLKIDRTYVEPLKDGQSPFDRTAEKVYVDWFLFDEYISIDELVYINAEDVCRLHNLAISVDGEKCKIDNTNLLTVDHGLPEFGLDWPENATPPNKYVVYYDGEFIFGADINGDKGILPKEVAEEMLKTSTIVGNTDNKRIEYPEEEHMNIECYWFETYDELISAIETLKAHGSTINSDYVFDCEGMMLNNTPLDCKYVISFSKHNNPPLQEGQNFFERKIEGVNVGWYAYDTFYYILEKNQSFPDFKYEYVFEVSGAYNTETPIDDESFLSITYDFREVGLDWKWDDTSPLAYVIWYKDDKIATVPLWETFGNLSNFPPKEFALEFVKTIRLIG